MISDVDKQMNPSKNDDAAAWRHERNKKLLERRLERNNWQESTQSKKDYDKNKFSLR